jgi:hypothetical protein
MNNEPEYLGDSVYARVVKDVFVELTTNNGYPDDPRNTIYLEPETWRNLLSFVKRHKEELGFKT